MKRLNAKYALSFLLFLPVLTVLSGCSDESTDIVQSMPADNSQNNDRALPASLFAGQTEAPAITTYALSVNGKKVPLSEIDALIELKLFDLEWARYELRKASLSDYLAGLSKVQAPQTVDVLLTPPLPPRLQLTPAQQASALRFNDALQEAPVRLSVFCNYQSSHCARMQGVYQQLQADYAPALSFEFFDFPQAFHQFSISASNAARCAYSAGAFEVFHKAMWLNQQALNDVTYLRLAKQLKLDDKQFQACLDAQAHLLAIDAHSSLATSLGFNTVPVTLVNGLYLSGPKPLEVFQYFIDLELARLTYQIPVHSADPASAQRADNDIQETEEMTLAESGVADQNPLPADMPDQDELEYTPRPVVPALGEIPLSREWIEDQLLQQAELEMHFEAAEHEVEGVRLTKLTGGEQSEFYQTLGLQKGDVLMRVNDQWVHEAQNDLFDALAKEKRISVVLVRKGLPVHLVYSIQD